MAAHSLGQDEFALTRSPQTVDLAVVFDPHFVSASGKRLETNDLGDLGDRGGLPLGGSIFITGWLDERHVFHKDRCNKAWV